MNNEVNNIDDLFDDQIGKSLEKLGFNFPKTAEDLERVENLCKRSKVIQPDRLKDPLSFLNKRNYNKAAISPLLEEQDQYPKNMAQAAREGKVIPDDIKKKMSEDKLNAFQKKNENK